MRKSRRTAIYWIITPLLICTLLIEFNENLALRWNNVTSVMKAEANKDSAELTRFIGSHTIAGLFAINYRQEVDGGKSSIDAFQIAASKMKEVLAQDQALVNDFIIKTNKVIFILNPQYFTKESLISFELKNESALDCFTNLNTYTTRALCINTYDTAFIKGLVGSTLTSKINLPQKP